MSKQAATQFSVEQLKIVAEAFDLLYDVLTDMPSFVGDFYDDEDYRTILRAIDILHPGEHAEADWLDEDV